MTTSKPKTPEDLLKWRKRQKKDKVSDGRCSNYMSQAEAAEHFGVCLQTYINWELGHNKFPAMMDKLI